MEVHKIPLYYQQIDAALSHDDDYIVASSDDSLSSIIKSGKTYEVRHVYDLKGGTLSMPAGCKLKFVGGKIKNGKIVLNGAVIEASNVAIFENITLEGNGSSDTAYPQWLDLQSVVSAFNHVTITDDCSISSIDIPDNHIVENHAKVTVERNGKGFSMRNYVEFHGGQVQPLNGATAFTIGGTEYNGRYRRCKIHDTKIFGSSAPGTKGINFITAESPGRSGWEYNCMEEITNVNIYGCHTGIYGHVRASFFDVIIEGVIEGLKILECNFNVFKLNGNASTRTDSSGVEYPYVLDMGNGSNNTVIGSLYDVGNTGWQQYMVNSTNPRNKYIGVVRPNLVGFKPNDVPELYEHSDRQLIDNPDVSIEYDNCVCEQSDRPFEKMGNSAFNRQGYCAVRRIDSNAGASITLTFGNVTFYQGFRLLYQTSAHKYQFDRIKVYDGDTEIDSFSDGHDGFFYKQTENLYKNVTNLKVVLFIDDKYPENTTRTTNVRVVAWQLFAAYAKIKSEEEVDVDNGYTVIDAADVSVSLSNAQIANNVNLADYGNTSKDKTTYADVRGAEGSQMGETRLVTLTFGKVYYYQGFRLDYAYTGGYAHTLQVYDGDTMLEEHLITNSLNRIETSNRKADITNLKVVISLTGNGILKVNSWQLRAAYADRKKEENNSLMPSLVDLSSVKYITGIYWFWNSTQKVVKYTSKADNKATDGSVAGRIMLDINQKIYIKQTCIAGVVPYYLVDQDSIDVSLNGFKTIIKQGVAPTEDSVIETWLDVDTTGNYRLLLNTKAGEYLEVRKYDNVRKEFIDLIKVLCITD